MKQLKCPKCGNVFQVDEADYASIVSQVKNKEFEAEVGRRISELHERNKAEQQLATAMAEKSFMAQLSKKDVALTEKDAVIGELKKELRDAEEKKATELTIALAGKDKEITSLKSTITESENRMKIAVMEEQRKAQGDVQNKNAEIAKLKADAELDRHKASIHENTIKEQYELKLKAAQQQIDYYKDLKMRMSTKMIGETLEIHCSTLFNQTMRPMMPNAYF